MITIELPNELVKKVLEWDASKERFKNEGFGTKSHINYHLTDAVTILGKVVAEIKKCQDKEAERETLTKDLFDK